MNNQFSVTYITFHIVIMLFVWAGTRSIFPEHPELGLAILMIGAYVLIYTPLLKPKLPAIMDERVSNALTNFGEQTTSSLNDIRRTINGNTEITENNIRCVRSSLDSQILLLARQVDLQSAIIEVLMNDEHLSDETIENIKLAHSNHHKNPTPASRE